MKAVISQHQPAIDLRTRRYFRELHGAELEARRAAEIAAVPVVMWKGRTLHTIRCHGEYGKGPHDVNLPESLLWNLIDLRAYRCPYHTR